MFSAFPFMMSLEIDKQTYFYYNGRQFANGHLDQTVRLLCMAILAVSIILFIMLQHDVFTGSAVRQVRLIPVKVSSFTPEIKDNLSSLGRYSEDQRVELRRTMVQTSFSHTRTPLDYSPHRFAKTSQTSRLSQYVQRQVSKLHEDATQIEQYSPIIRDKIKQLRLLMQQKAAALRSPSTKLPQRCCFSEYKMDQKEQGRPQSLTLHSRKKIESPYMRALKSKKFFVNREESEGAKSSEDQDRKIVVVGGGLNFRLPFSDEKSLTLSPTKLSQRETSRSSRRYYLRQSRPHPKMKAGETTPENDCQPWEIHKMDHMEEFGHMNYL